VELHDEPVLGAQARHLHEHVGLEGALVGRGRPAGQRAGEQRLGRGVGQPRGVGLEHGVVGGRGAEGAEVRPPLRQRRDERGEVARRRAAGALEAGERVGPAGLRDAEEGVGAEGGHHAAGPVGPARGAERPVVREVVAGGVGGGEHLEAEALEQGAGAEVGAGEPLGDLVVHALGGGGGELHAHAEQLVQHVVQPGARGRAAEEVVVGGEPPPRRARVALDGRAAAAAAGVAVAGRAGGPARRHAEGLHGDALRVEHPEDVVVGREEQRGGLGERRVVGQQGGGDVPVRRDDRQRARLLVEPARQAPHRRVRVEEAVRVQHEGLARRDDGRGRDRRGGGGGVGGRDAGAGRRRRHAGTSAAGRPPSGAGVRRGARRWTTTHAHT
jgi:hypothetical protein